MGANTALQDSCDLGRSLIEVAKSGRGVEEALRAYERTMIPRGRTHVLESRASDVDFDMSGGRVEMADAERPLVAA